MELLCASGEPRADLSNFAVGRRGLRRLVAANSLPSEGITSHSGAKPDRIPSLDKRRKAASGRTPGRAGSYPGAGEGGRGTNDTDRHEYPQA